MAVLTLPGISGWREVTFDPVQPRSINRMLGRRTEGQTFGSPFWRASYTPVWLDRADFGKMDAFMMRAGDGGEVFRAYDPFRPRPIAMDTGAALSGTRAGGGAFDGTATLDAITSATEIVLAGLPAGFIFGPGDYVEIRESEMVTSLHRVMEAATADGAGEAALSIKYPLDTQHFTTDAVVHLEKPSCLMQIEPGSYSGAKSWDSRQPGFSAIEVFFYEVEE